MKHEYVVTKNQGDPYWHVDEDGKCIAVCFTKPIAVTIRSRLSEHDRLKAKAELFDEMREQLGKSTIVIGTFIPDSDVVKHNQELLFKAEALSKTKELK